MKKCVKLSMPLNINKTDLCMNVIVMFVKENVDRK